ncbi:hypothetical protein [Formosa sp. 4Alg 33]
MKRGFNDAICNCDSTLTQNEEIKDNQQDIILPDTKSEKLLDRSELNKVHLFLVLSYIGLFTYILSKEKVEDDYINKLRLESYQLSVLLFIILSLIIFVFFKDLKLTFDYFLESFMLIYLIIFFFKKRIY